MGFNKKCLIKTSLLSIFVLIVFNLHAYTSGKNIPFSLDKNIYILELEENTYRGFPIFHYADSSAENVKYIKDLLQNSFANQSIKLYNLTQTYLLNTGQLEKVKPLYLLISGEKKGAVSKGFYLRIDNEKYRKTEDYYIDYRKNDAEPEQGISSFPQIFSESVGHIIYKQLVGDSVNELLPLTPVFPNSGMVTDFRTAFERGFAMHLRNVSIMHDKNHERKENANTDLRNKKAKLNRLLSGYLRDFYIPVRLDYYRLSAFYWFDAFESVKQIDRIRNKHFKYHVKQLKFNHSEKALFYRNSGVKLDSGLIKNYQQTVSTEGIIASFFNEFVESKLNQNYKSNPFYRDFCSDMSNVNASQIFSPLENQYLKIFKVLNKYNDTISINNSLFIEFIEGYLKEFPEEKGVVMRLFEEVSGNYYTSDIGPELWLLVKNYKHGTLVYDQFGGNRSDFYTFNLNAASKDDFKTIKEIKKNEIDSIILYREHIGYFSSLKQLDSIPGLSENSILALQNCNYDHNYVKTTTNQKISTPRLYFSIFARLVEKGLFYLLLFITFYYLLFYGKNDMLKTLTIKYVIRKILKLYILVFIGYITVLLSNEPLSNFLIISVIFIAVEILLRKREKSKRDAFLTSFFIIVMIILSIW